MSVKKIRPIAEVKLIYGDDGREYCYIAYSCPVCHESIYAYGGGYGSSDACDRCGTLYDWGTKEPRIKIKRTLEWD